MSGCVLGGTPAIAAVEARKGWWTSTRYLPNGESLVGEGVAPDLAHQQLRLAEQEYADRVAEEQA